MQNLDEVDNLNIAGKAGRFIGTIRGNGTIEILKRLKKWQEVLELDGICCIK